MYKIAQKHSELNKITPAPGDTLESIAASDKCEPGTTWQQLAQYNWGTVAPGEVNRALIELVGCKTVNETNPEKSVLDPELGTTKALHVPKAWVLPDNLAVEKTHTIKVAHKRPAPAVVLPKVDPWFIPETESCEIEYRLEGIEERANKLDFDVYASKYCKATPTEYEGFYKFTYADVDVPVWQKRAFTPATLRKSDKIADWKGESEAKDGILKPRDQKKRYLNVAQSPYTVQLRYYKADADKDARITINSFWPRFKKVLKSAADTTGLDGANATDLKTKTEASITAARELETALTLAEYDIAEFLKRSEKAALRAHSALQAATRAVTDITSAKSATETAHTNLTTAFNRRTSHGTKDGTFIANRTTARNSAIDAKTKSAKAETTLREAAESLLVAKAAAKMAATHAAAAKTSATEVDTKADSAKTKAGDAKNAAAAAPDPIKKPAASAADQSDAAKPVALTLKQAATATDASAIQCRNDANSPATQSAGSRDDAITMNTASKKAQGHAAKLNNNASWNDALSEANTAKTDAGTAKTKADQAKSSAETLVRSADAARVDAEKLREALAAAKKEILALTAAAEAADDNIVYDKSLRITWKVEGTAKLKHGQLLISDKEGKLVFRKPLAASDLAKDTEVTCDASADDQKKYWLDDKTKLDMKLEAMPYRVQIQAHSGWDENEGVAVTGMHTEVRLWQHKDNGSHPDTAQDSQSLHFALAPYRPDKDPPTAGSVEWYKLKLAELGYNPGPVNKLPMGGDTDSYKIALKEFQRSFPKEETAPFTRMACNGAPSGDAQAVLARTDVADAAHQKTVDVKAETKAALDAVTEAKVESEKAATGAGECETEAIKAEQLANEALLAATQAATDAEAAARAIDQAHADRAAADQAQISSAQDAPAKAQTAKLSAKDAEEAADKAAQSAATAETKAGLAKDAADAAKVKALAAKASTALTDTKAKAAKTKAEAAKQKAASTSADVSVTGPVDDTVTKAGTAETSAGAAKTSGEAAETASEQAKLAGPQAVQSTAEATVKVKALQTAAKQVHDEAKADRIGQASILTATAIQRDASASSAANTAKTDVQTLKEKAAQAKTDAAQLKLDAEKAKTDIALVALDAKTADDAAETERVKKKQRKDDVDGEMRPSLAAFGNPQNKDDYTSDEAVPLLTDKSKELIVWADDCHYYTAGCTIAAISMDDYRLGMEIGDGRVEKDGKSIPRPWIPLEVHLPLLSKSKTLQETGAPPAITDAMRRAVGPIRIDWTFDELPPEVDNIPDAPVANATAIAALPRAAKVKEMTALALLAATAAKAETDPLVTPSTEAKTELDKLVLAKGESVTLAEEAAVAVREAQEAADTAKLSVEAAVQDAGGKGPQAKLDCAAAEAKAIIALQKATAAADKVTLAKAAATAMAVEVTKAKAKAVILAGKLDDLNKKIGDASLHASISKSGGAVSGALTELTRLYKEALKSFNTTKADIEKAETLANACRDLATTAEEAVLRTKSLAQAVKDAAELAKGHANGDTWPEAQLEAAKAALKGGEATAAANQGKVEVEKVKQKTDEAKPEVEKLKTRAEKVKTDVEAMEPQAQTADTEAENDRSGRTGANTAASGQADPAVAFAASHRSRSYVAEVLSPRGEGKLVKGKRYSNCPRLIGGADAGGIRPDPLDDYYKAAFGVEKEGSNRPWLAIDDTTNKVILSVAHDDLGQDEAGVFAACLGKAGVYLNPSRVAGDGYRFRAQVSFNEIPGGASHPNREVLLGRYPRLPAAHTAGLRVWRKASIRGYVGWLPNAIPGWQGTMSEATAYYAAAHVHFIYEGPAPGTPLEFTPVGAGANDLIPAADYVKCVEDKLFYNGGPYHGIAASYRAGYIWPYLDQPKYAIKPKQKDLSNYAEWLSDVEEESWDNFSDDLIHRLIEGAEKKLGHLRGHTLAEFRSSPPVILIQYECNIDPDNHVFTEVANDDNGKHPVTIGTEAMRINIRANNAEACADSSCTGTYVFSRQYVIENLPLCAIGQAVGGCWLFTGRKAAVWAHEMGHHRHFEHAQADGNDVTIAPGGQVTQHDAEVSDYNASTPSTFQRAWDRFCIMSYDKGRPRQFCGKCLLKNRGWRVETLTNPAGDVQDA